MIDIILDEITNQGYDKSLLNEEKLSLLSTVDQAIYLTFLLSEKQSNILVIKSNLYLATQLYDQIKNMNEEENVVLFTQEESLRLESIASSPETNAQAIESIFNIQKSHPKIIICSCGSLIKYICSKEEFNSKSIDLSVDYQININELKDKIIKCGYQKTLKVEQPLTYSIRGGIIDIFSVNYANPIRIEFFDNIIESIRFFDIETQRTISKTNDITIIPATLYIFSDKQIEEHIAYINSQNDIIDNDTITLDIELLESRLPDPKLYHYLLRQEDKQTVIDYIEKPIIFIDNLERIQQHILELNIETNDYINEMVVDKIIFKNPEYYGDLYDCIANKQTLYNDSLKDYCTTGLLELNNSFKTMESTILDLLKQEHTKKLIALNEKNVNIILEYLVKKDIEYNLVIDEIKDGLNVIILDLIEGFEYKDIIVYTEKELISVRTKNSKYKNKFLDAMELNDYQELNVNDYVVHNDKGIGIFKGIVTKNYFGHVKDYLIIEYADNEELSVPVENFTAVRKFSSNEGAKIKLNKLTSNNKWSKTKEKVRENLEEVARKLVELFVERQKDIGFAFSKDTKEQKIFENEFDYELTKDQKQAVIEIKEDMESSYPMDRLVCGDVGFGKTEVAIRAAFKAIQDNKQVAFLCPTTVLAMQHYETFKNRFKNQPINIEVINRFVNPIKQKEIINKLKEGTIDIIIGTHRVLSSDVIFNSLGLLVIDEEQRFGVVQKEKIKELRSTIDVLSLSATPIPRTLQMSLIGMKKLSTLNTPPRNRLPVQTYVIEKSQNFIVEIIQRELQREGQVFYLLNNVTNLYDVKRNLSKQLKNVNIGIVHGQMQKEDIENVMVEFNLNMIQILVCTTIIETGIDIPNANTIIVENAQRFGLSQLYQIRGRVGRSDRMAYAYFMVPKKTTLTEVQEKRLKAIKEFTKLGSGFKIAKRDLMIRGAGDLLGPTQSGFIDSIGIDLYLDMLKEAISIQKGEVISANKIIKSSMKLDNYLPNEYSDETADKIDIYQQIELITDIQTLDEYKEKIIDTHGKMPKVVNNLFLKRKIEIHSNKDFVESLKEISNNIEIFFTKEFSLLIDGIKVFEYISSISSNINITIVFNKLLIKVPLDKYAHKNTLRILENIERFKK